MCSYVHTLELWHWPANNNWLQSNNHCTVLTNQIEAYDIILHEKIKNQLIGYGKITEVVIFHCFYIRTYQ